MTNQVLYRKWRPQRFREVVGQDSMIRTLTQAISQRRVAHGYLLCGPRGTGKTSTARILAKALNCFSLDPKNFSPGDPNLGEPDNNCQFCQAANEGRALDIIEMDAASNRGIDDIRNLRERVFGSGPAEGRAKVYIIDEVHMLTEPANNALLKTLEEPAPWAYFVLCTTEAHKIPATIISRCQRFDLRRISSDEIFNRLSYICEEEQFNPEPEAIKTIARKSWGSLRDACNLLDQSVTSFGSNFTTTQIQELLGISYDRKAIETIHHILSKDIKNGLSQINKIGEEQRDMRAFHQELLGNLHTVFLLKSGVTGDFDLPVADLEELKMITRLSNWDHIFATLKIFAAVKFQGNEIYSTLPIQLALIESIGNLDNSHEIPATGALPKSSGEIAAQPFQKQTQPPNLELTDHKPSSPSIEIERTNIVLTPTNHPDILKKEVFDQPTEESPVTVLQNSLSDSQWDSLGRVLRRFKGKKFVIGSLLMDCIRNEIQGSTLILTFKNRANLQRFEEEMEYPPSRKELSRAMQEILGREYSLQLIVREEASLNLKPQGHLVRSALNLGGKIISESETNQ